MPTTLTKEHFDQQMNRIDERFDAVDKKFEAQSKELKGYVDKKIEAQSKELKHHTETQIADLAAMVKKGFDSLDEKLDVRTKVEKLEREMKELRDALHL